MLSWYNGNPDRSETYMLSTAELAGIPTAMLGKPMDNLKSYREDMIAALDFVFTGI